MTLDRDDPTATSSSTTLRGLLDQRFSCRAYLPDQVPQKVIEEILGIAQRTASWCNSQPWQAIVTVGNGTERFRKALFEHAQSGAGPTPDFSFPERYVGIYKDRQRECGWQLYGALGIAFGDRAASGKQVLENFRFFGAPHTAVITTERDLGVYGVLDCGGYVSNFLLAAASHGVSCIAQAALAVHGQFIREYFNIPDNRAIVCGISFGFADNEHAANGFRTSRADIASTVRFVCD